VGGKQRTLAKMAKFLLQVSMKTQVNYEAHSWASAEIFPGRAKRRHFAYPFQVSNDAMQMNVGKMLYLMLRPQSQKRTSLALIANWAFGGNAPQILLCPENFLLKI